MAGFKINRTIFQSVFAVLSNSYLPGFINGTIYTGNMKTACVPGLNCYSCPGALGSCPIGAMQVFTAGRGAAFPLYVVGFLTIIGVLLGRFVCGFLCPFGLFQDLLYKIPFIKKFGRMPGDRLLKYLPYIIFVLFVILIPILIVDSTGLGAPAFCKYICPSGTLGAGIPLVLTNESIAESIGGLFTWKMSVLILIVVLSIVFYRPFCRYLCPLGAVYGLFNPVAFLKFGFDKSSCIGCGKCKKACRWDIDVRTNTNSRECIRCGRCINQCENKAIYCKWGSRQGIIKKEQNA